MKRYVYLLLIALGIFTVASAKITLPAYVGNHMVLQQQSDVCIWGNASPNKKVTIITSWDKKKTVINSQSDGKWKSIIKTPSAGGPHTISISDGEELILNDILIGEVWFCSGQSNMEMPVKGFRGQPVFNSQSFIVSANPQRELRLFTVGHAYNATPMSELTGSWAVNSPENVSTFSATAYFFGDLLQKTLNVPVGLINCSWSMSKIEAWMDKEALSDFPEVELPNMNQKEFGWIAGTPTLLWNGMVNPWKGFPVKGVLWYQGEANTENPDLYKRLFPVMVSQWRSFFNSPKLPFYYVQIAPWQSTGNSNIDWALFRECQLECMKNIPYVGMAVTTDAGSELFIHSPYKIKVGERLAYWALAKTYNIKGFSYCGPLYKECKRNGSVIEVTFDYGEDGLTPENAKVQGFEIAGTDGLFLPAKAEIINGSAIVKVWNDSIDTPAKIRYCFRNYIEGNLCNNAGLPAYPFRAETEELKPALMWFDAEANFARFTNPDSIDYYLNKIKSLGFTHAVVDIRPITGEVLYDSKFAPKMREWKGVQRGNFDYLGHFIQKAHELGLEVHASLNVFSAGHNYFDRGQIYSGHPEWASVVYNPEKGLIPITEEKHKYAAMVNPINPDFRKHILQVLKEVVEKYPALDGLMLDRVRYDGISADFSDLSKKEFETYIGKKIKNYPEDIFKWKKKGKGSYYPERGKYFLKWIEWRTKNIYDFMIQVRREVKSVNRNISFGTYTGAWYPSYYEVGVNFASKQYDPNKDFDWATSDYKNYAYGDSLDLYATGNYYTDITKAEYLKNKKSIWNETDSQAQQGIWYCVEGSCEKLHEILKKNKFMGGILVDQFYDNPAKLPETIEMNLKKSDGLMVFDIVHIIQKNLWKEIEEGMRAGGNLKE